MTAFLQKNFEMPFIYATILVLIKISLKCVLNRPIDIGLGDGLANVNTYHE